MGLETPLASISSFEWSCEVVLLKQGDDMVMPILILSQTTSLLVRSCLRFNQILTY